LSSNAEFQHFILRFNKVSVLLQIPLKDGIEGDAVTISASASHWQKSARTKPKKTSGKNKFGENYCIVYIANNFF
jgi:hypothetical protein